MNINCSNTAPSIVNQFITINEDGSGSLLILSGSSDPDGGDIITFSGIILSPSNGSLLV